MADDALASLADAVTPQGLVAVCRHLDRPLAHLLDADADLGLAAVCADVRDPGNAGTVLRCADAAGAGLAVLAGHSVDPYNPKAVRASAGSLFHLPAGGGARPGGRRLGAAASRHGRAGRRRRGRGRPLRGRRAAGGADRLAVRQRVLGAAARLAELADHRVRIPILGGAESLNLATAAAVCLYASARVHAG